MSFNRSYDYNAYFEHGIQPTSAELERIATLTSDMPDGIIDAHTHASTEASFHVDDMSDFTWGHMVSTYPVTTIEQSSQVSDIMLPGKRVQKVRFAHAFRGIEHAAVNAHLSENCPPQDRVALFGLHDTPEEVDYTVAELETAAYSGLKMYYSAGKEPVYDLFDYFPKPILKTAEKQEIPIILHLPNTLARSMDEIDALTAEFPQLRVVLAHVGVSWVDDNGLERLLGQLGEHKNIAVDTSGVADKGVIAKALGGLGSKRVLFGTDEPLNLLRERTYENPELGPRIISDFQYHWVDPDEFARYKDTVEPPVYSQVLQIESLGEAIRGMVATEKERQDLSQAVFHDNAKDMFGF